FLRTANDIGSLNSLTEQQISAEEQILSSLKDQLKTAEEQFEEEMAKYDEMLDIAQRQLDAALGTELGVMSVEAAIANLASALSTLKATPVPTSPGSGGNAADDYINQLYQDIFGRNVDAPGLGYWKGVLASGDMTADQFAQAIRDGARNEDLKKVRGFAVGTNYVPEDMNARIHQGERIIPEADNRELMARLASPDRTASLLQQVVAENREMKEVIRTHLYPIAKTNDKIAKILDRWDVDGQPE